jgi:hypothetical protein
MKGSQSRRLHLSIERTQGSLDRESQRSPNGRCRAGYARSLNSGQPIRLVLDPPGEWRESPVRLRTSTFEAGALPLLCYSGTSPSRS